MVTNLGAGTYEEKLKKAGLTSLKERRKRGDLRGLQDAKRNKSSGEGKVV